MKNSIELLNSEGPILIAVHAGLLNKNKTFAITDRESSEEIFVSEAEMKSFLNGDGLFTFCRSGKVYDYKTFPDSMKPERKTIKDFLDYFLLNLEMEEWRWVECWTDSYCSHQKGEGRLSKSWYEEAFTWSKENVSPKIYGTDYKKIEEFFIPRMTAHIILAAIGSIAYSFEVKTPTSRIAYEILCKLEKQMSGDENWKKNRH